jgi:hypothetical protein
LLHRKKIDRSPFAAPQKPEICLHVYWCGELIKTAAYKEAHSVAIIRPSIVLSRFGTGAGTNPSPARKSPLPMRKGMATPEQRADKWVAGQVPESGSFAAIVADRVFGDLALNGLFSGGAAAQQAPFVKQYDVIGERQHRGTMGDHNDSAIGGFLVGNHFANDSLGRSV